MKKSKKNPATDLFGEVVVTLDEVELWLDRVAGLPKDSPRRAYYAKFWNVADRIKAAKLNGMFDRLTG